MIKSIQIVWNKESSKNLSMALFKLRKKYIDGINELEERYDHSIEGKTFIKIYFKK